MTSELTEQIEKIAEERNRHLDALRRHPTGLAWCEAHTDIVDRVVRLLYESAGQADHLPPFALIATGGYGRRELSPYSDVDITIVPSDEASTALDAAIRRLFQDLHWAFCTALRLDVGYAYRLISDAPGLDAKTRTGLMDMRLVAGSHELFRNLDKALTASFSAGEFILGKITERESMFAKFHDTPLVVEPQLKEGAGGVRCFHCANWLREALGERAARPTVAYDKIVEFRNLLHLHADKHQDLLTRQRQAEIAESLGVDMYAMMSGLASCASEVHKEYRRAKEKLEEARFPLSDGVVSIQGEARLAGQVDGGEAAVGIAFATQLGLRVEDIPVAPPATVRGPAALFAVSTGEKTLRNLDRCGLLGELLPELEDVRTTMPTDTVHAYTVFEHTLRVVRQIDGVEEGRFLGEVKSSLNDLEPLYLAALLHDIGKSDPESNHCETGAEMARAICERWKLDDNITNLVVWLIREHLTMSRYIRIRDLMNPQTITEFAAVVQDLDRLSLLTLLTWADISAVAPTAWTPSQQTFLEELYHRTAARLQGDAPRMPDPAQHRQRLLRQLAAKQGDEQAVQRFVESLPAHYLVSTPTDVVRLHLQFAKKAESGQPTVELFHRTDISATEVTVCCLDSAGLLSRMLGVFYAFDLNVGIIRACTTDTDPPVALDVFTVSFAGRPVPSATCKQVTAALLSVIEEKQDVLDLLTARGKDPIRRQGIYNYTYIEGAPGVLEVRAPRGRGMPFRFSRLVYSQGWNITAARVGQWAGNATAAFYLLGPGHRALKKGEVEVAMSTNTVAVDAG